MAEVLNQPIDSMLNDAFRSLCLACRVGDYESVETLLPQVKTNVNSMDEWNYSPLVLASLCGHYEIVRLLLSSGAVCDRDTFEGARCIHGALNDKIRNLLLSYDITKKVDVSQPFASHLSSLLTSTGLHTKIQQLARDVVICTQIQPKESKPQPHCLNRFLLAARLKYFKELIRNDTAAYKISNLDDSSLQAIVNYIYLHTANLPLGATEFLELAEAFGFKIAAENSRLLAQVLDPRDYAKIKNKASTAFMDSARDDMKRFLHEEIFSNKITKTFSATKQVLQDIELGDYDFSLQLDLADNIKLKESGAIPDIIVCVVQYDEEDEESVDFANEINNVDDCEEDTGEADFESSGKFVTMHYYPVHRIMLAKLLFFKTMFESDITPSLIPQIEVEGHLISDRNSSASLPIVQFYSLSTSSEIGEMVLSFLYHDDVSYIPNKLIVPLLVVADELLLDRLKARAAISLTSLFLDFSSDVWDSLEDNVGLDGFDLIRVSWNTFNERIEQSVTKLLAYNLAHICSEKLSYKKLGELIIESASRISNREDTDTIELVDDIRYYLEKKYSIELEEELQNENDIIGSAVKDLTLLRLDRSNQPVQMLEFDYHETTNSQYNSDQDLIVTILDELDLAA